MAQMIEVECIQCGEEEIMPVADFVAFIQQAPNTRVNLEDSGALKLRYWLCQGCAEDSDEEYPNLAAQLRIAED